MYTLRKGRVLLVASFRTGDVGRSSPLRPFLVELDRSRNVVRIELGPLTPTEAFEQIRAMLSELDDRTSEVTEYILQQQEALGEELVDYLVDVSGDDAVDIIRSLRLMSMTILADEHGGADPFAVLEYGLDTGDIDDVLLVNLASDGSVQSVSSAD